MAINQNHPFEDVDGIRCAVVEKNCKPGRVEFLKALLEFNRYEVLVTPTPPPKAPAAKPVAEGEDPPVAEAPLPPPSTFTVYVTNPAFNVTNAIFGRLLRTPDGHVVTSKYWQQKENMAHDEVPYFKKG